MAQPKIGMQSKRHTKTQGYQPNAKQNDILLAYYLQRSNFQASKLFGLTIRQGLNTASPSKFKEGIQQNMGLKLIETL